MGGQEGETGSKGFMGAGEKTLRTRHWVSIAEPQQCFSVQVSGNMAKLSILVIQVPGPRGSMFQRSVFFFFSSLTLNP